MIRADSTSTRTSIGIRTKLIAIFIVIKVLPLVLLALFLAWKLDLLGLQIKQQVQNLTTSMDITIATVGGEATDDAVKALDERSREAIERLTTDTAKAVAEFLYDRDRDLVIATRIPRTQQDFREFIASKRRHVIDHDPWVLTEDDSGWVPVNRRIPDPRMVKPQLKDNEKQFSYRPPETREVFTSTPLYKEITFLDLDGKEQIKASSEDRNPQLKDISQKQNTYLGAETYFSELESLGPGEIYVSHVIGEYVPSRVIGPYTRANAKKRGVEFEPHNSAYAGKENPLGKRFRGIVRWAAPVFENGQKIGYLTLALNHIHLMEFTDHVVPTEERYSSISDASSGNYAFMWDFKGRNISHPRDYFIVGYDAATGEPVMPWLEASLYENWQKSGQSVQEFIDTTETFQQQSLQKKPAVPMIKEGTIALDCRFLNFAPQCKGWMDLTQYGGSGSFVIFWSGLWKLTTAAAIPYYTGQYGLSPRGFGFITIGANVDEFHLPAVESKERVQAIIQDQRALAAQQQENLFASIRQALTSALYEMSFSTAVMTLLVIGIAIWMASYLSTRITALVEGVKRFTKGDLKHQMPISSGDEMGQLTRSINDMAANLNDAFSSVRDSEARLQHLLEVIDEGIWDWDLTSGKVSHNNQWYRSLKLEQTQNTELADEFKQHVHPDDLEEVNHKLDQLISGRIEDYYSEHRLIRGDEAVIWVEDRGQAVHRDESGKATRLIGSFTDITKRKIAEVALKSAKEEAEMANRAKSEFLATMSHEIRTPMNGVIGMTSVLADTDLNDEQNQCVETIRESGEALLVIINDILDISRLEANQLELEEKALSIEKVVKSVLELFKPKVGNDQLEVRFDNRIDGAPVFLGDIGRIRQVIMNLVSNAIKFTSEGSVIITAEISHENEIEAMVKVSVTDTGIGISVENQKDLFQPFNQVDSSSTSKYGGTGLGLSICRRLVTLMKGKIAVDSQLNEGSVFWFEIPLKFKNTDASQTTAITPVISKEDLDKDQAMNILVVEDIPTNQLIARKLIEKAGHVVEVAENGLIALSAIQSHQYDLIFMDIRMPEMDGLTATREIRKLKGKESTINIIAMTANATNEDVQDCLEAGMNDFIPKPINKDQLLEILHKYSRQRSH